MASFSVLRRSGKPILHEVCRSFGLGELIKGIILSGTGLTQEVVKVEVKSIGAKLIPPGARTPIFTHTGDFGTSKTKTPTFVGT